jgi:glycoside/pentoside/hexuronide:cation symporter, GPH family
MGSSISIGTLSRSSKAESSGFKSVLAQSEVKKASENSLLKMLAYGAPAAGSFFFYTPMWSILPAVYVKYFGLELSAVATVVLLIRLFDGITDPTIGYLSDRHRAANGSRKLWVVSGGVGVIFACYHLFIPPEEVTISYYLIWSMAYFLVLTISEVPHMTWGNELTMDYNQRAKVFSIRYIFTYLGSLAFYALPLLPFYTGNDYTPEVLHDAIVIGAGITLVGVIWAIFYAPPGKISKSESGDSFKLFKVSLTDNKPFLIYCAASGSVALAYGMWFGLIYFFLDAYLQLTEKIAMIFMVSLILSMMSTPFWLNLISRTSKSTAWITGVTLFCLQLIVTLFVGPDSAVWIAPCLIVIAYISFASNDIAALSSLGYIVDYGKIKFHKDRGATYYAVNSLIFKVGLGVGGGISLGCVAYFGFDPTVSVHSNTEVAGLKLAFVGLPLLMALVGMVFISLTPINKTYHSYIQRRIENKKLFSSKTH